MASKTKAKKPSQAAKKGKAAKAAKPKAAGKPKASKTAAKAKAAAKPKADTLSPKNVTKTLTIMAALKSNKGITIDEMMKMTDWQSHTA